MTKGFLLQADVGINLPQAKDGISVACNDFQNILFFVNVQRKALFLHHSLYYAFDCVLLLILVIRYNIHHQRRETIEVALCLHLDY